jgi:hypothetical protein
MATQVIGSLAVNNLLPIQLRAAGSVAFGPFAVPAGYTNLDILFDLQQVATLTAVLAAHVELSPDGSTWGVVGDFELDLAASGYRLVAGVLTRSPLDAWGPGPVRYFGQTVRLFQTDLTTRQVRGTLTSSEGLISGVTLVGK